MMPVGAIVRALLPRWFKRSIQCLRGRDLFLRPDCHPSFDLLGSHYGGWPFLHGSLDTRSIVYSVGVGTDISFDLALIDQVGCVVHAFDPTPRSMAWVGAQTLPDRFRFHPTGLWSQDGILALEAPVRDDHVSFHVRGDQRPARSAVIEAPVRRLTSLMAELGHDRVDVLKMDIEGAEYRVIDDILAGEVRPVQWLVEFHHGAHGFTASMTRKAVERIRSAGYSLFYVSDSGRELGFLRAG